MMALNFEGVENLSLSFGQMFGPYLADIFLIQDMLNSVISEIFLYCPIAQMACSQIWPIEQLYIELGL